MPKCKDCALFEDCMADENDVPENFDCEDFTPKEEAPTEEVIEEAEEVWGEEAEMTDEFEGFDEEEIKEAVALGAETRQWSMIIQGAQIDFEEFKKRDKKKPKNF